MRQTEHKEFNSWVVSIIWVNIIIGGLRGIMRSITNMLYSPLLGCIGLGQTIIGIISLYKILDTKKWGLFLWIAYMFVTAIINDYINIKQGHIDIITACCSVVIMFLMLQIKKNGVSAWSIIFDKRKESNINEKNNPKSQTTLFITDQKSENTNSDVLIEGEGFTMIKPTETLIAPTTNHFLLNRTEESKTDNSSTHRDSSFNTAKYIHDINIKLDKSVMFFTLFIIITVFVAIAIIKGCNNERMFYNSDVRKEERIFEESVYHTTPESFETSSERWDAENCIYANFMYGIAFTLPCDMAWHKVSGTSKHTIVKFVQPDTQLTLFVNHNPIQGETKYNDIWDIYDEYIQTISSVLKNAVSQNSAETIEDFNYRKAEFCGKHAVKVRYTSVYGDDRHEEKTRLTTIDYSFFYNNGSTTVSVKCFNKAIDYFREKGITLEDFLKGFQLIPISK